MVYVSFVVVLFFFFKQKTAYEMRISDWSSDVCSSDLQYRGGSTAISSWGRDAHCLPRHRRPGFGGVTMMVTAITLDNIEHLAIGSSFLGTGGGGDPYLGSLLCREAIAKFGPVRVMSVDELSDVDNILIAPAMGATPVMIEKLFSIEDQHRAVETLEIGRAHV